jgi:hypothetical protein
MPPGVTFMNMTCPYCRASHDVASGIQGERGPEPGDCTVCGKCAMPSRFGPGLVLEPWPNDQPLTPEVHQVIDMVRRVRGRGAQAPN